MCLWHPCSIYNRKAKHELLRCWRKWRELVLEKTRGQVRLLQRGQRSRKELRDLELRSAREMGTACISHTAYIGV